MCDATTKIRYNKIKIKSLDGFSRRYVFVCVYVLYGALKVRTAQTRWHRNNLDDMLCE